MYVPNVVSRTHRVCMHRVFVAHFVLALSLLGTLALVVYIISSNGVFRYWAHRRWCDLLFLFRRIQVVSRLPPVSVSILAITRQDIFQKQLGNVKNTICPQALRSRLEAARGLGGGGVFGDAQA